MRAVLMKFTGVAAYLAFVAGLGGLCLNLSRHVGTQAVVLASPYLFTAKGERPLTLVERRQREASVLLVAEVDPAAAAPSVPDTPPLPILAAQMDLSEMADLSTPAPAVRRAGKPRARHVARPERVAAADVFGRSFGVMLMASQ